MPDNESPDSPATLRNLEWLRWGAVIVCNLGLFGLFWYSKANFVSRDEYKLDRDTNATEIVSIHNSINTVLNTLTRIDTKMETDARRDKEIDDHESRLRVVERAVDHK